MTQEDRNPRSAAPLTLADLPRGSIAALKIAHAFRSCKRCNKLGRVSDQGVIHVVEDP